MAVGGNMAMVEEPIQRMVIRDVASGDHAAVIDLIWHLNCFKDDLTGDRATDHVSASGSLDFDIERTKRLD